MSFPAKLPNVDNCGCIVGFLGSVLNGCFNYNECTIQRPCSKMYYCEDTDGSYNCHYIPDVVETDPMESRLGCYIFQK